MQIGETEHQVDVIHEESLHVYLAVMSDSDIAAFNASKYCPGGAKLRRGSFFVYGYPCDRLILKLDAEAFLSDERVQQQLSVRSK